MERMTPVYDRDGSLLYFEAEYPKEELAEGSRSPYYRGEAFEDSEPVDVPEIPRQTITRPEW